jgi:hypothetical protein
MREDAVPIHLFVGLLSPDIVCAHYVALTTPMRSLAEAKPIRQTLSSAAATVALLLTRLSLI